MATTSTLFVQIQSHIDYSPSVGSSGLPMISCVTWAEFMARHLVLGLGEGNCCRRRMETSKKFLPPPSIERTAGISSRCRAVTAAHAPTLSLPASSTRVWCLQVYDAICSKITEESLSGIHGWSKICSYQSGRKRTVDKENNQSPTPIDLTWMLCSFRDGQNGDISKGENLSENTCWVDNPIQLIVGFNSSRFISPLIKWATK